MIEIKDLFVSSGGTPILQGLSLSINPGEIHAIMGPNGSGKSTLSKVIAGHPDYEVDSGDILFEGESILDMDPEERAQKGVFVSFQYPPEIPGVSNFDFLFQANNSLRKAKGEKELEESDFRKLLAEKVDLVKMSPDFLDRSLNEDFSGGEKKRNEILQLAVLDPAFAVLDETDSGLDIDALKIVANGVRQLHQADKSLVLITHYQRLLNYIEPDFVHVLMKGKIVTSGGKELAMRLEKEGYDWLLNEVAR